MKRRDFVKAMSIVGAGLTVGSRSAFQLRAEEVQPMQPNLAIKRVAVMFKCHFDAGFIDTQYNVVHKYFNQYFPHAIEIARRANEGGKRRYVWTTGSWLLFEYLEQASAADRKTMEEAIGRGDIAWHALPFTWQTEMLDASMIEGSLAISKALDKRFGRTTTGAKMTDVPGHTRGMIAPLAKHGVGLLEIGVNGGSTAAKLPPLFLWKDASGASLPMMYHWDYEGIALVPGSDVAVVTRVRDDNSGPHTADEIAKIHGDLAARFPNAEITAGSLSDLANAVAPHRDKLPVVTEEIGDTWIHGCASDPKKVARYREVARLREGWIAKGAFAVGDATDLALLRHVLLDAEHTWGTDTKTWLDFDNYEPADLYKMLDTKKYKVVEWSWIEKRQDLLDGLATLPETLREEAQIAIEALDARWPVESPKASAVQAGSAIETEHFVLGIDAKTGAITRLRNEATGKEWASETNPVALFTYQTLSNEHFRQFMSDYLTTKADWALKDFGKPNIERFGAKDQEWHADAAEVWVEEQAEAHRVLVKLTIKDDEAFRSGRAAFPRAVFVEMVLPKAEARIDLTLTWFGKPATRMPEALWLTFNPIAEDPKSWMLEKTGEAISPFDVVTSGNRHMHCVQKGFAYERGADKFAVETLDAPIVALGERSALLFSNEQPDLSKGLHSCLYNNTWGTNYIMWYGEDVRARYVLRG